MNWAKEIVNCVQYLLPTEGFAFTVSMVEMYYNDERAWEQQQQQLTTTTEGNSNMPIIQFSDRDMNYGKVIEPAWYVVRIDSVGEAPSKDGGSTNYPVEGTIIKNADNGSEDFAGSTLIWNFNSKAIGFAVGFLASFGVDVKAGARFDLANAAGKMIEVFVENGEYNGRIVNRVNHKYRALRS